MSYVIVDVESDGPIPAEFSMVCFGAVIFDDALNQTFYGRTRPVSERFNPEALATFRCKMRVPRSYSKLVERVGRVCLPEFGAEPPTQLRQPLRLATEPGDNRD